MLALESSAVTQGLQQPRTEAARRNWNALLRCVRRTFGYVPEDLCLEWADFAEKTRHFGLVIFQDDGTAVEAEFVRRGRRWFCSRHETA